MTRWFWSLALLIPTSAWSGENVELLKAVSLYASFDEHVKADRSRGEPGFHTRYNNPDKKGGFLFETNFDHQVFRIAKGKGISGGCLEAVNVLPNNGRIFLPAKNNLAFKKGGWGGALSVWIDTDPNELLKTTFCDPIQITQKGANNGGIWFDFNNAKPRDLRMGVFPAVPEGARGIGEDDANAPMVRVPKIGFKKGQWQHVVLTWSNFDTGKADAVAVLWINGKKIGAVKDRPIAMNWDVDKAGIYVAVNYIGLLDELALFDRALTADEVAALHRQPGLLAGKK